MAMLALDPFQATQRFQAVQLGAPGAVFFDPDMVKIYCGESNPRISPTKNTISYEYGTMIYDDLWFYDPFKFCWYPLWTMKRN